MDFEDAQAKVKTLSRKPENHELLELYSLYKQGSSGDVNGKRPGMIDFVGRAKYDAWAGRKGMGQDKAKDSYVAAVERLIQKYGLA